MSSPNMTKDEQKAASPAAETEGQTEIRALKAKLAELEATAAAKAKSSTKSAAEPVAKPPVKPPPGPVSSSTPTTGGSAVNESGYFESGEWPRTDPKLHPPQQRQRLQNPAPRPPQPKKSSIQGHVEGPSGKEKQKQVSPAEPKKPSTQGRVQGPSGKGKQQQVAKTERPATLGGHEVTSGAEHGLAGSKHAPGNTAPRQTLQPRGQGRGNRGRGGQARGGAAIKKEESEMRGIQIRGASQRGRSGMLPPSRPPPLQTPIPTTSPPLQQPCHMPYCRGSFGPGARFCHLCGAPRQEPSRPPPLQQPCHVPYCRGSFGPGVRFCPLCGASRQEPSRPPPLQQPCHVPYCRGSFGPGVRFCPLCGASRQEPQDYGTYGAPSQGQWDSSPHFPYADSRLGARGSFSQYSSSPAPSVHLTFHNNAPSQPSSAPLESFPTRGSATPAPPATSPSRPLKRERSPFSSLHAEARPAGESRGAKRRRRLAAEKAAARAASTVLPSIETPQPLQLSQPSLVADVAQQVLGSQPGNSGDTTLRHPIKSEPDSSDEMEFAPASSDAGFIKEEPI